MSNIKGLGSPTSLGLGVGSMPRPLSGDPGALKHRVLTHGLTVRQGPGDQPTVCLGDQPEIYQRKEKTWSIWASYPMRVYTMTTLYFFLRVVSGTGEAV